MKTIYLTQWPVVYYEKPENKDNIIEKQVDNELFNFIQRWVWEEVKKILVELAAWINKNFQKNLTINF